MSSHFTCPNCKKAISYFTEDTCWNCQEDEDTMKDWQTRFDKGLMKHLGMGKTVDWIKQFIASELQAQRHQLIAEVERMERTDGVAGCTWGDTDYDSKSVEYGYNQALDDVLSALKKGE